MEVARRDINRARTPTDLQRRYKFDEFKKGQTEIKEVKKITENNSHDIEKNKENAQSQIDGIAIGLVDIALLLNEINTEITKETLEEYYEEEEENDSN